MKSLYLIPIAIALLLTGCASQPLSQSEQSVRILRKSDPDKSCQEMGKVISFYLMSITPQGREDVLKQATVKKGGDTVSIESVDSSGSIHGTAYRCGG